MIDHFLLGLMEEATRIPAQVRTVVTSPYEMPYQLPTYVVAEEPDDARKLSELKSWTGWSNRTVADIIGTTHPTIRALGDGRVVISPRNREYRSRLHSVHSVVSRVFMLAGRDRHRTRTLLSDDTTGESPMQLLRNGEVGAAYAMVLEFVNPPRPSLITSWSPLSPRGRTIAPFDEE
jgi:hypothetical protein